MSSLHILQSSGRVECFPLGFGFGFDPKSNDYKAVRILTCIAGPEEVASVNVDTYALSTDSWREVTHVEAGICHLQSFECLCLSEACYWMARGNFRANNVFIFSFDISDEVFGKISAPKCSIKAREESRKLLVFNESLAFVLHDAYQIRNSLEIWVMDEFGINGARKKLFIF